MKNFLEKLHNTRHNLKTYQVGLLQTKAYRKLNKYTQEALKPYQIGTVEWALLGVLYDTQKPMSLKKIATKLDVEPPFVTELIEKLKKQKLVSLEKSKQDGRKKLLSLSEKGQNLVPEIEKMLFRESKKWLSGLSISDVINYIHVLNKISKYKDDK